MSKDWYQDMIDFHIEVMEDTLPEGPTLLPVSVIDLRKTLILEEVSELFTKGLDKDNLVEIADGIVDSIVVLVGTAVRYGIDIRPIWDEIHSTNMAKKFGPTRKDGKKLKPANWQPPKVRELLNSQIRQAESE
jgi:predicted HAD superfamily Cof-like phosphohydrolase